MIIVLNLLLFYKNIFQKQPSKHVKEGFEVLSFEEPSGNYIDTNFLNVHTIPRNSYTVDSTGSKSGYEINNAFDNKANNYWVSDIEENSTYHPSIFINFTETFLFEAFIYYPGFGTDRSVNPPTRSFDGFPGRLKVYTALGDEPLKLNSIFSGTLLSHWDKIQFVLSKPIKCTRLQFEFYDVSPTKSFSQKFPVGTFAAVGDLTLIKNLGYDPLTYKAPTGNYAKNNYVNFHKLIPKTSFTYSSTGDTDGRSIDNAFDDANTYWVSDRPETNDFHPKIFINFTKPTFFEAFFYETAYHTPSNRIFDGFPHTLKVYTAVDEEPFELNSVFTGELQDNWDRIQCALLKPINCTRVMFEFTDVSVAQSLGSTEKKAAVRNLILLKSFDDEAVTYEGINGNYEDSYYYSTHLIPFNELKYSSTGDKSDKPLRNLFDDTTNTYWVSEKANSDDFYNSVFINFTNPTLLEGFILYPAFNTNDAKTDRTFQGCPTILRLYTALDNQPLTLNTLFVGTPVFPWERIQFVLPKAVNCTRIQLEFVDVTPDNAFSNGAKNVALSGIFLMKSLQYDYINYEDVNGRYLDTLYLNSHRVYTSNFTYGSNGDKSGYPIGNAFDSGSSSWVSSNENSDSFKASIFVNFTKPLLLEAIIIDAGFKTVDNVKQFSGFPLKLKVYSSINNQPLVPKALFLGSPHDNVIKYQFVFPSNIPCSRLQLEFIEVMSDIVFSSGKIVATVPEITFYSSPMPDYSNTEMEGDMNTFHVNESFVSDSILNTRFIDYSLPKDDDYLFIVEKEFSFKNITFECTQSKISAIKTNLSSLVLIDKCVFNSCSVKNENGNGGAVLVHNCPIQMESSDFMNCSSSTNGGGGGIYAILDQPIQEKFNIESCTFDKCSASYGGAVYLYSNIVENSVSITKCLFTSNYITSTQPSTENDLTTGGSAILLVTMNGAISRCKFLQNKGDVSVKIVSSLSLESNNEVRLLSNKNSKSSLSIKQCLFEIDYHSSSSLSLVGGSSNTVPVSVDCCIFVGELSKGSHHIESSSSSNKYEKKLVEIKNCKFSSNQKNAMKSESKNSFIFNVKEQEFNIKSVDVNEDLDNVQWKKSKENKYPIKYLITLVSLAGVSIIAMLSVIIFIKNNKNSAETDIIDPLNTNLE